MGKKSVFLIAGVLFIVLGLGMCGISAYDQSTKESVTATVAIREGRKNSKYAHVTYEYNGVLYQDKGIGSYNAFTMKDGKEMTVYIDPLKPDQPQTTNWGIGVIFALFGGLAIFVAIKRRNSGGQDEYNPETGYFKEN